MKAINEPNKTSKPLIRESVEIPPLDGVGAGEVDDDGPGPPEELLSLVEEPGGGTPNGPPPDVDGVPPDVDGVPPDVDGVPPDVDGVPPDDGVPVDTVAGGIILVLVIVSTIGEGGTEVGLVAYGSWATTVITIRQKIKPYQEKKGKLRPIFIRNINIACYLYTEENDIDLEQEMQQINEEFSQIINESTPIDIVGTVFKKRLHGLIDHWQIDIVLLIK
ncbi:hypothetical protein Glove_421g137 [Diversispora epigaea]|uniref:Uncharacterized protein n=1 Tax=Diversispora epigaea TaxID=1348612 RepID=A0A397GX81_9GLOM|nr:hypothetical protein Glove_421g137 [Diversispora epigaea]